MSRHQNWVPNCFSCHNQVWNLWLQVLWLKVKYWVVPTFCGQENTYFDPDSCKPRVTNLRSGHNSSLSFSYWIGSLFSGSGFHWRRPRPGRWHSKPAPGHWLQRLPPDFWRCWQHCWHCWWRCWPRCWRSFWCCSRGSSLQTERVVTNMKCCRIVLHESLSTWWHWW